MFARSFLTICLIPALLPANAQTSLSRHFTQPAGTVYSILRDGKGFMWFGTSNGLVRYDGHTFTTYTHKPADSTSLSDSFIRQIIEDQHGYLWVSTLNGGLNRLNPANGQTVRLADVIRDEDFLKTKSFSSLATGPDGSVWVGSDQLYRIDPQHFSFDKFELNKNSYILSICFSSDNALWIGTNGDGFGKYDLSSQKADLITVSHNDPVISERVNVIRSIAEDKNGYIWLGTYGGLVRYNPQTRSLQHWTHNPDDAGSLPHNSIWNVIASPDNKIWISTWGGGITFFDMEARVFKNEYFRPGGLMGMEAREVPGLYLNESGSVWAGTNSRGIYKVDLPDKFRLLNVPFKIPEKIYSTAQLINWGCIVSETEGVYLFKDGTQDFFHLTYANQPGKLKLSGNRIAAVCERMDGMIFFGTESGLTAFNPANRKITWFRQQPGNPSSLSHNDVMALTADENDRLWVGTPFGLSQLNDDGITFTRYVGESLPASSITALATQGKYVAIGTGSQGLFLFDKATAKATSVNMDRGLNNNYVRALCFDNNSLIWVGTPEGLNIVRVSGELVAKPEIFSGNAVIRVHTMQEGILVVTENGYFMVAPDGKATRAVTYDFNNVPAFHFQNAASVLVHLNSGLYALPLFSAKQESTISPVVLTRFELAANSPNPLPAEEAALHPAYRNSIVLDYNQNFFSFEFSLLDYKLPEQHRYAYRLTGFDRDWNYSESRRFASYTNIPPGTYVLQLKAKDASDVWHVNSAALSIIILPPWWRTTWAYAGYALLAFGLLWVARKQIVNRERLKAQVLIAQREREALKEVDHLKSQFFSNITHEFRTPLTLIQGPAEELLRRSENPEDKRLLFVIKNNSQRLLQLINQLLDLSRLDAQRLTLEETSISFSSWLRSIISQFVSIALNRKIDFRWQIAEPMPDVMADEKKLEAIIMNLISNALKFTPENGKVTVEAEWKNNLFSLRVADTGWGIPVEDLPHIFSRFYQVRHPEAHHAGGSGIGLTLVKEYTELMKGKIQVESTPGKGSIFTVMLPLQISGDTARPDELPVEEEKVPDEYVEKAVPEAPLVLLVEDNDEIRLLLKTCLGNTYHFEEASDGKAGWEKAIEKVPDLIISDLMMPEMDGLELCTHIKTDFRTQHIPFIMLTAKAGDENRLTGLQTGADDYLVKPFNRDELNAKVHNLLQLRENIRRQIKNTLLTEATPVQVISAEEQFVMKARQLVEENLSNPVLSVEWLAGNLNLGREQCYRKMMAITGLSPSAFIRKIRLQRAAQLLAAKWGPVSQVAYEVGYENLSHFSKAFKEEFGKLPSEYAQ